MRTDLSLTPGIMKTLPLVALAFLAACSSESATTEITSRDSAGVTIIEHPAGAIAAAPEWTLGPATATIAHGATDEDLFTRITDATRLSDGRIVMINGEDNGAQPLLYSANGTFEHPLGRPGAGPGEFRSAVILNCRAADTLCFFDFNTRRVTRVTPTGAVAGTLDLSRYGQMALGFPRGMLADGRIVSVPFVFDTVSTGGTIFRSPNALVVLDPVAEKLDTVASAIPGGATYIGSMSFGERSMNFPMPAGYGEQTLVLTSGDQIVVATNETSDIVSYALPWNARRIVRFREPRTPVDAAAKQAFIDRTLQDMQRLTAQGAAAFREQMAERVRETKFVDSMPYYGNGKFATDGSLWLMRMNSAVDTTRNHLVLGPDGRIAARVTLPRDANLLWASGTEVLIGLRDADEVPRIELRAIVKPGATP